MLCMLAKLLLELLLLLFFGRARGHAASFVNRQRG